MPRRHQPLPYPLPLGPFRFAEAIQAQVPRSRLRASDVAHPHRGVYLTGAASDQGVVEQCEALLPLLHEDGWFSHLTAARLWEMPLPLSWTSTEDLHVVALSGAAPARRRGVVGWETADTDTPRQMLGIVPVIAPAEVWCQLAVPGATGVDAETGLKRNLNRDWLVAVGDYLLTGPKRAEGRVPLCTRRSSRPPSPAAGESAERRLSRGRSTVCARAPNRPRRRSC